ncbi:LLM class flavin-dependent oxidoreductase [Nesterenkonia flava]
MAASLELARRAEDYGYHRLWFGEHHLNPGVMGYSPALVMALAGSVTTRLRVGSGAVLAGARSALSIAEEFSLLQAALPGRIDLGLGRSPVRRPPHGKRPSAGSASAHTPRGRPPTQPLTHAARDRISTEGLLLPAAPDLSHLLASERYAATAELLAPPADSPPYAEFIDQVRSFLDHTAQVSGSPLPDATQDTDGTPQVWVLGSSAGESAEAAGRRGLRFGANYHVAPSNALDAVEHYRSHFVPHEHLERPTVMVSAEVLVADSHTEAERLAHGYDTWVHSIRSGEGAIPYPRPGEAAALTGDQRRLVEDRVRTRFVGTPGEVIEHLRVLQRATSADELLISTITHDPAARLRSYELLAESWDAKAPRT